MFGSVRADFQRYLKVAGRTKKITMKTEIKIMLLTYGFHATLVYRLKQYLDSFYFPINKILSLFYFILSNLIRIFYGIYIDPGAKIGKGLYIGHFGGIYIGKCNIGENCSINHQVMIGEPGAWEKADIRIGNNVWIGAHSKIREGVIMNDHATIAAGSIIEKNMFIKTGSLMMGNPARIIKLDFDNSSLL